MLCRIPKLCRAVALAAILAPAGRLPAQLAADSPFLPPQAKGPAGPTAGAPLEFRGYIETPAGIQFRVFDPARTAGDWLRLNEHNTTFDVTARQYDRDRNTLTVEYQGRTLTLAEREAKIVSAGSAVPPPMVAPAAPPMPAAITQSVVVNPTPAQEQQRLEAVAAEVARRRALREQAAQQMGQPALPPQAAPAMQPPRTFPGPPRSPPPNLPAQNQPGAQRNR